MNSTRYAIATSALLAALGGGVAAQAENLFIAGTIGQVYRGDAATGGFELFAGTCLAPVQALACDEANIYAGDLTGAVIRFDLATGKFENQFFLPSGVTAMVMDGPDLLVSDELGTIRRVDPMSGVAVGAPMISPASVQAMAIDGNDLFVAGTVGEVYRCDLGSGVCELFAGVCLGPIQALALDDQGIYAGDLVGGVARFDRETGDFMGAFFVPNAVSAMVFDGDDLLVSDVSRMIRRFDPVSGRAIGEAITAPINIEAMKLVSPDVTFCPGDLDGGGDVTFADLVALLTAWGPCPVGTCPADVDGTGDVGFSDLIDLLSHWGPCP